MLGEEADKHALKINSQKKKYELKLKKVAKDVEFRMLELENEYK